MNRRTLLRTGGAAMLGVGLGGLTAAAGPCTADDADGARAAAREPRRAPRLGRARDSDDGRTAAAPRCWFVLRAEKLDDKTAHPQLRTRRRRHVARVGLRRWSRRSSRCSRGAAGGGDRLRLAGLTAARQLQRRGFDVTIYAMAVPPYTTSNMSLAGFTPTTALIDKERRTPAWDAQFRAAAEISYRQLQLMAAATTASTGSTATTPPTIRAWRRRPRRRRGNSPDAELLPERCGRTDRDVLGPGEHPFPTRYAVRTVAPGDRAVDLPRRAGARLPDVRRSHRHPQVRHAARSDGAHRADRRQLHRASARSTLFDDKELVPIKGQLTAMVPQPEVNYRASARLPDGGNIGINPRRDGLVVGNSQEPGVWSLEPNPEILARNLANAAEFFAGMRRRPPACGSHARAALADSTARELPRLGAHCPADYCLRASFGVNETSKSSTTHTSDRDEYTGKTNVRRRGSC